MSFSQEIFCREMNRLQETIKQNNQTSFIKKYCSIIDRLYVVFKSKTFSINSLIWNSANNYAQQLVAGLVVNKPHAPISGLDIFLNSIKRAKEIEGSLLFVSYCFYFSKLFNLYFLSFFNSSLLVRIRSLKKIIHSRLL